VSSPTVPAGEPGGAGFAGGGGEGAQSDEGIVDAVVEAVVVESSPSYSPGANGACVPRLVFGDNVDNSVAYTFIRQHKLTREAASDLLRQRSRRVTCRTEKRLNAFVQASVDVHHHPEDSCRSGWGAFVAHRESHASCDYCGAARRLSSGAPDKQTVYYSLSALLRTMLADPEVGPSMTAAMAEARAAAKAPVDRVRDWHDGMKFREAGAAGLFDTDLCVALSISMDGL